MLAAYFDASGTHNDSPIIVVAGYVAEVTRWRTFQSKWADILKKENLSFFHMTDFESGHGPYKGWPTGRRTHLIKKLCRCIKGKTLFSVSRAIIKKDYRVSKEKVDVLKPYSAFTFSAVQCMRDITKWADANNRHDPIAYTFESGDGYDGELDAIRNEITGDENNRRRYRFCSLNTADKRRLSPLQAADILGYEIYKETINFHLANGEPRTIRKCVRNLLMGQDHFGGIYEGELLPSHNV